MADMYADAVLAALIAASGSGGSASGGLVPVAPKLDRMHFKVSFYYFYILCFFVK